MAKQPPQIFYRSLFVIILCIGLLVYLFIRPEMPKESFTRVDGQIEYIGQTYKDLPNRHFGKYRYILIDTYYRPFELFIGKETGDFSPKYEKIDQLIKGDFISIYYDDRPEKYEEPVNRLAYFIDRNNEEIYIQGFGGKTFYLMFGAVLILFIGFLFYLRKTGKII
jgi:hypothetical protein